MSTRRYFLSCDWGTSAFRLRLVRQPARKMVDERVTDMGVASLTEEGQAGPDRARAFAGYLRPRVLDLCRSHRVDASLCPVVVSGMAGSSIGWRELPYARTPFPLDGSGVVTHEVELDLGAGCRTPVILISGMRTDEDVIRGEETEILGLFAGDELARLRGDCTLVLPGTHSKHVRVSRGAVRGFSTFMTGELFSVLRANSILRHSTAPITASPRDENRTAFARGVDRAGRGPLFSGLFRVRTRELLDDLSAESNAWYLSGLLVGSELAALRCAGSGPVAVCAGERFGDVYGLALRQMGLEREHLLLPPQLVKHATVRGHARVLENFPPAD